MTSTKATLTLKFLKNANYDSKLFKVCEVNVDHKLLSHFVKVWEDCSMIYLKEKYLNEKKVPLVLQNYYRVQLCFEQFTNSEGKDIVFVNKIRHRALPEYTEKTMEDSDNDSDF